MSTTDGVKRKVWLNAGKGAILPFATLMLVGLMVVPVPATGEPLLTPLLYS